MTYIFCYLDSMISISWSNIPTNYWLSLLTSTTLPTGTLLFFIFSIWFTGVRQPILPSISWFTTRFAWMRKLGENSLSLLANKLSATKVCKNFDNLRNDFVSLRFQKELQKDFACHFDSTGGMKFFLLYCFFKIK